MNPARKEFLSALIFILTNLAIAGLCFFAYYLVKNVWVLKTLVIGLAAYALLGILAVRFEKSTSLNAVKVILQVFLIPFRLIQLLGILAVPVLSIQLSLLLYLTFSFIVQLLLFRLNQYFAFLDLKTNTWIYLVATSGVMIAFLFHRQLIFLVYKIIPYTAKESENTRGAKLWKLNDYVLSEDNIRLVIFSLYFLLLATITIMGFEGHSFYKNQNIDKAILNSLLTYIAFDRVLSAYQKTEFRFSNLLVTFREFVSRVLNR